MGKKKKTTVGYKYSWDIQSGLGRGPVDEIVAITADDKYVFTGTEGEVSANKTVYINQPGLFGGSDVGGEGGVQGILEFYMGESNQVPSDRLKGLLKGVVPGFRGVVTTFFSGMISAFSASPKPWKYRVRRVLKGWDNDHAWYPEKALIVLRNDNANVNCGGSVNNSDRVLPPGPGGPIFNPPVGKPDKRNDNLRIIHAMNPAHILMECATNRDWGRGLSFDDVDTDAYKRMADTLYNEKFGLCFRYNRQDSLDTFIQQILDHIGGVQYGDLTTGKLTAKLIRDDYDPEKLPLFTYDNGILRVQDDDSSSADKMVNEVVVTWHDPVTNKDDTVRAKNLASIQSVGLISQSVDYKALPTHELAARVAQRELEAGVSGLTRLVIFMDRRGGALAPADCFRIAVPDRGIENMILRVGGLREQDDGSLKVTALQDVFGLPSQSYSSGQQGSQWIPPDNSPHPVTLQDVMEVPYYLLNTILSDQEIQQLPADTGFVGVLASPPGSQAINYELLTRAGSQGYSSAGLGDWTPLTVLQSPLAPLDTLLKVSVSEPWPVAGDSLLIDDEIAVIQSVSSNDGSLTLGRGCADTLPAAHATGATVWFLSKEMTVDPQDYLSGEVISVKVLTRTASGALAASDAPEGHLTLSHRQARPYPPGNLCVDGKATLSVTGTGRITFSWSHRDRVLQGSSLLPTQGGNVGPEQGTQYRLRLCKGNTVIHEEMTSGTSWCYPPQSMTADQAAHLPRWEAMDRFTLFSLRDGMESWQGYSLPVSVTSGSIFDDAVSPEPPVDPDQPGGGDKPDTPDQPGGGDKPDTP
ncbi:TPA: hypothetical protein ACIVB1_001974, partial [Salmonella enterica subsp. diarizonae serovar 61:l,v:z35]